MDRTSPRYMALVGTRPPVERLRGPHAAAVGPGRIAGDALRPLGHYVQVGHFGKDLSVPWDHVAFRQLRIDGSVGYTRDTWLQTLRILAQGRLTVGDLITHRFPLAEWQTAFDLMERQQALKILLMP